MMYNFCNLPTKNGASIECEVLEHTYLIRTSDGYSISNIHRSTPESVADGIANAVRRARNIGYEQALSDVRNQLGIK